MQPTETSQAGRASEVAPPVRPAAPWRVTSVEVLPEARLRVRFIDGTRRGSHAGFSPGAGNGWDRVRGAEGPWTPGAGCRRLRGGAVAQRRRPGAGRDVRRHSRARDLVAGVTPSHSSRNLRPGAAMQKTKVHAIEVVKDAELRKKEAKARAVVKRFFPNAG